MSESIGHIRQYIQSISTRNGLGNSLVEDFDQLVDEGADPQDALEIVLEGVDDEIKEEEFSEWVSDDENSTEEEQICENSRFCYIVRVTPEERGGYPFWQ